MFPAGGLHGWGFAHCSPKMPSLGCLKNFALTSLLPWQGLVWKVPGPKKKAQMAQSNCYMCFGWKIHRYPCATKMLTCHWQSAPANRSPMETNLHKSSASLILLLLPCCHFFLFHFACMATNQSWGPFTRPGAALLQGLCTALMLELAKTAKREVCRKCGGEHKPLPQATATPSPSFQVFPLLATFLKQLPFSKALAICCQPFARHYMLPFSLFQGFENPFHSQSCFQQLFLGSFHVDLTALLHQLLRTIQRCLHRFGMGCVFGATAAFWDVMLQWLQQCDHFDDPFGS